MNARVAPVSLPPPLGATAGARLAGPRPAPPPCHDARALTGGGASAQILLDGQVYTLRITRAGKLILTK